MIPRATYRLQLHAGFTFGHAERIVPYLDRLGISHVYASPITTAAPGSTHGYDVIDPTRVNPELGGEDGLRALVATLGRHDMGLVIDIVPNHMGVAGDTNPWWNDVLAHGQGSEHAAVFDIDWSQRIVLPILGTPLREAIAAGALTLESGDSPALVLYGERRLPVRGFEPGLPLEALLERQAYRLAWWRVANDELNWRRFFAINELAGVRIEDDAVFEKTHALYFRLWSEGLIDGVRIDHVDGLTDPAGYCRRLRERLATLPRSQEAPAGPAWIVVEKILGFSEPLPADWGIDGTSGYDFMEQVSAVLHDPAGAEPLAQLWHEVSGRPPELAPEELLARQQILAWQFTGQLEACVEAFVALARSSPSADGVTDAMLRRAIERLLWVFPVYRTYGSGSGAPPEDAHTRDEARERVIPHAPPSEMPVIDLVLAWLAGTHDGNPMLAAEAVRRFQQLSAPIAAKALEDTAFYRYGRLLSRNDVGFDAARMAMPIADFHTVMEERARTWPRAMLTTATHDHKRGEDARARLAVLSATPARWRETAYAWEALAEPFASGVDRGDRYLLFQALLGAWPEGRPDESFADRIAAWQTKALREAKLRSSWEAPDEAYEKDANTLARTLVAHLPFVQAITAFVAEIRPLAMRNTLAQVALRCTAPGVPDLYQGTEFLDLSLVDPDNRRPVDYQARAAALDAPAAKLALLQSLLGLRRFHEALFRHGSYVPARVDGPEADRVLAFERQWEDQCLRCLVALRPIERSGRTTVRFGEGDDAVVDAAVAEPLGVWFTIAEAR